VGLRRIIAIFSSCVLLSVFGPGSFAQDLYPVDTERSASELVSFCSSVDADELAYCEGYIDGATLIWKLSTACTSIEAGDQSFCAGGESARDEISKAFKACKDCDIATFRPELGDDPKRVELFMERMNRFRNELKAAMGTCTPDEHRDVHFCSGYNAMTEREIAELSIWNTNDVSVGARDLGLEQASMDLIVHFFASEEIHEFQPCLQKSIGPQQTRNILLEFVHDHPEQQRETTAIIILEKALFYGLCPGPAQQIKPHMEQCTRWEYDSGEFGTENTCDKSVAIQFMVEGQQAIERQIKPGKAFSTGLSRSDISRGWWMFTTCPAGYVSSVPFLPENKSAIAASRYSCERK
jgi:hypothetical protein